jgi:hypothetical protein
LNLAKAALKYNKSSKLYETDIVPGEYLIVGDVPNYNVIYPQIL